MVNEIIELTKINFSSVFIAVFVILVGVKAIVSLFEWVVEKLGLETKWMRTKREEHELLIKTSQGLIELKEHHKEDIERSDRRDEEISNDLKKLIEGFRDLKLSSMRREILNLSDSIINGEKVGRESYIHCLKIYDDYEKIIEENGLTNSEVDFSIEIIRKSYMDFCTKEKEKNK